jgi:hypothetical protein
MITNAKFEALGESEGELDKEATELKPLFSRGKAIARPFGEEECESDVLSPGSTRTTVRRFCRDSSSVASLPPDAQAKVRNDYQPIVAVRLGGHAGSNRRNMLTEWQIFWRRKAV